MKITAKLLKKWFACEEQVKLFKKVFPNGVVASVKAGEKALKAGLDVWWLFSALVGPALRALNEATCSFRQAAGKKREAAADLYARTTNAASAAYIEATRAAGVAFDKTMMEIDKAYDDAIKAGGPCASVDVSEGSAWQVRAFARNDAHNARGQAIIRARDIREEVKGHALDAQMSAIRAIELEYVLDCLPALVDALNQMEKQE